MVLLICLAVLGLLWAVRHLDTSLVKHRLRALVRDEGGLELDYASAKADLLSGLSLREVTIASPPGFDAVAPTLVRAGVLNLGWSLFGGGSTLRKVVARDVDITIVVDEAGHTSIDTLRHGQPSPPSTATPGQRLGELVRGLPAFERLDLARVTLHLLQTRGGQVVARTQLGGLELRAESRGRGLARHVELALGDPLHRLALALTHQAEGARGSAAGTLWLALGADARVATLHGELALLEQSLSVAWPHRGVLLGVDGAARAEGDKLSVALDRLEALTQAVTARGVVELAPQQTRVGVARGALDLTRLVRLLPPGRLPLVLREGHIKYDVAGLELQPTPRLDGDGHLTLEGRAADLDWIHGQDRVELDAVRLTLEGKPLPGGGLKLAADLPAGVLTLGVGRRRVQLSHAESALKATLPATGPGQLEVRTRFEALSTGAPGAAASAGWAVHATRGLLDTRVSELRIDPARPLDGSGALTLAYAVDTLELAFGGVSARATGVKLAAHAHVTDGAPGPAELDLPIARLVVTSARDGVLVPAGTAHVAARVADPRLDRAQPLASTGTLHVEAALGGLTLAGDLHKERDGARFDVTLDAPRTALLTAFAPPSLALPGGRMSMALAASGRVDDLAGTPRLKAKGTLHLGSPAVTLAQQTLAAESFDIAVESDGTLRRQSASLTLRPHQLTLDDDPLGDGTLSAKAHWDVARSAFDLALVGQGQALPSGHLALAARFDHQSRVVDYRVDGDIGHLGALDPLLPASLTDEHWLDLSALHARLSSHGHVGGVISGIDRRGLPMLAAHPLQSVRGDDELDLAVDHVHYVDADGVELTVPSMSLTTRVHAEGADRRADVDLRLARAIILARGHRLDVSDVHDEVQAHAAGDPLLAPVEVTHTLAIGRLGQDLLPLYPVGNLTQVTHARRAADGAITIDDFSLTNGAGGTRLSLQGGLTLARGTSRRLPAQPGTPPVGFSSLQLALDVQQRLDTLAGDPGRFHGGGSVGLTAELASGDLRRFHATATLRFHETSVELPTRHIRVSSLDGTLPIVEDFVISRGRFTLFGVQSANPYPQLRYSDQHPFVSRLGALRVARIVAGDLTIEDAAGSLRLTRNQIAVDQLDAGVRGGRLAGSLVVDWRGPDSTAQLKLRASAIESVHGGTKERFDGNAALTVSLAQRNVDGRVEVVRIGRHHLYDLLDEYDPHHKDAATNRIRKALSLGYPERAELLFDRGFASLSVSFGGLARLFKISEVRGIATGPLVERYLGPLFSLEAP